MKKTIKTTKKVIKPSEIFETPDAFQVDPAPKRNIPKLDVTFQSEDLNKLASKINEIIENI